MRQSKYKQTGRKSQFDERTGDGCETEPNWHSSEMIMKMIDFEMLRLILESKILTQQFKKSLNC